VGCPKPLPNALEIWKRYKREFIMYFTIISKRLDGLKLGTTTFVRLQLHRASLLTISAQFQVFFIVTMDPIITLVIDQYPMSNEEALIDQDSDVFDTEIAICPIFVSRSIFSDNVGNHIPFLEAIYPTIVPYVVQVSFPFP
jgi:hypothetical protein